MSTPQQERRPTFVMPPYDAGKSHRTLTLIGVTCFLFFAAWAYVFFVQKPQVTTGAIETITPIPLHTELRQGGTMAEGYGGTTVKTDEMLVWVAFDMKNVTADVPLYETGQRATLTFPDGQQQFATAESPVEIAKLKAVRGLRQPPGALVPSEATLTPGHAARGLALFVFPVTKQQWDSRREFSIAVSFQWQRDLALREATPAL